MSGFPGRRRDFCVCKILNGTDFYCTTCNKLTLKIRCVKSLSYLRLSTILGTLGEIDRVMSHILKVVTDDGFNIFISSKNTFFQLQTNISIINNGWIIILLTIWNRKSKKRSSIWSVSNSVWFTFRASTCSILNIMYRLGWWIKLFFVVLLFFIYG